MPLFFYSFLYWETSGLFVDWQSPTNPHAQGPWFEVFVTHQHLLAAAGTAFFIRAAMRMGRSNPPVMTALLLGVALPLVANAAYMLDLVEADWTDCFWGAGQRPAVAEYWQRLSERPSYWRAIESVRCPATRSGMQALREAKAADPALAAALESNESRASD